MMSFKISCLTVKVFPGSNPASPFRIKYIPYQNATAKAEYMKNQNTESPRPVAIPFLNA